MTINVDHPADIRAIMGSSGCGKSHWTKAQVLKEKRLLVWDMEDEYTMIEAVSIADLPARCAKSKTFKLRVVSRMDKELGNRFNLFCRLAMAVGNVAVVAEELRFVTTPSRAPEWWAGVTLRGRKRGLKIFGTSQRPASIDKDFLSNATYIRCGALTFPPDRQAVADAMGCNVKAIEMLEGFEAIEWQKTPRKIIIPQRIVKALG